MACDSLCNCNPYPVSDVSAPRLSVFGWRPARLLGSSLWTAHRVTASDKAAHDVCLAQMFRLFCMLLVAVQDMRGVVALHGRQPYGCTVRAQGAQLRITWKCWSILRHAGVWCY
jgi:hypothetical protein